MMGSQLPQPGDVVIVRSQDQDGDVNLPDVVLVARRDEPLQNDASDLSNVVPFARPRRHGAVQEFPLPSIATNERPAPSAPEFGVGRRIALLAGSMALHSILLAMFWQEPKPMASIGIEVMTVEVTLGATTAAGLAPMPGEQEVQVVAPSEQATQDEPEAQQARAATVMPQEVPVAAQETAPEAKPQEKPPEVQTTEPRPQEPLPEPEAAVAEIPAATQPTERPPEPTVQPPPQIQTVTPAPERKRIAAPTQKKATEQKQRAAAAPTDAASGIGRGRSDNSANYNGMVAAHLARYKQYPADARAAGSQGVAAVSFGVDGGGRVTSVSLARGSGNASIDREVVAMVRRASPFPRPPDGRGRNFTVPVRFNLR